MNKELITKIVEIRAELNGIDIPVDPVKLMNIRTNIVDLLDSATNDLNEKGHPMTSWQKEHIVSAINAIYWDWLHLALSSIELAITDPSTISSKNKYVNVYAITSNK